MLPALQFFSCIARKRQASSRVCRSAMMLFSKPVGPLLSLSAEQELF